MRISWIAKTQRITPNPTLMYLPGSFTMLRDPIVAPMTTATPVPRIRGRSRAPVVRWPATPKRDEKITIKLTTPAEFFVG